MTAIVAGPFSFVTTLTDRLAIWSANWWFLGVIGVIALLDSIVPIVPGETAVILGGVAVSTAIAPYNLWMVIGVAALGAFVGDNLAYSIGRRFAGALQRRADRHPKFAARLTWAERQIKQRGGILLVTARFIPGGRTLLTLASGATRQSRAWFMAWIAAAVLIWAGFSAGLAYVVGKPFHENHTAAFWVAFGTALAINAAIEVIRHRRNKRRNVETMP